MILGSRIAMFVLFDRTMNRNISLPILAMYAKWPAKWNEPGPRYSTALGSRRARVNVAFS